MKITDIHCHLFDLYKLDILDKQIQECDEFSDRFSVALSDEEIDWHLNNRKYFSAFYAGIHPKNIIEKKTSLERIIQLCEQNEIIAIGEIGLDRRYGNFDKQNKLLLTQLDIAQQFNLPVVFHNVKMYYELAKIIKNNFPQTRGILHGFNGSEEIFHTFKQFNFAFSLNCRFNKNSYLQKILNWGRFFLETDAPFQAPFGSETNSLNNIKLIYETISNYADEIYLAKQLEINKMDFFDR